MLTPEEQRRLRKYNIILAVTDGDVTMLSAEESLDLVSLMNKLIEEGEVSSKVSTLPGSYQMMVRKELRKMDIGKLWETYGKLMGGETTGMTLLERDRASAMRTMEEVLWERGKLPTARRPERLLPMSPEDGPPFPQIFSIRWPWKKEKGE